MAGILNSVLGDILEPDNASSPFATLGRFLNTGLDIAAGLAIAEVAGGIGGGLDLSGGASGPSAPAPGITPSVTPTMTGPSPTFEA